MLRSRSEVDDVVADAFAGVLEAIRNGNGPRDNFRSYLLAAVRNGCRSRWQRISTRRRAVRAEADDSPVFEDPERYVEADTVARAFASLSPRWQQTLWLTEVEQRSPAEVAAHLHLAPNATAALTHRAREAFATAYLAEHIDSAPTRPVSGTRRGWQPTSAISSPTASAMTWSGTSSTASVASRR